MSQQVNRRRVLSYAMALTAGLPLVACSSASAPTDNATVPTENASAASATNTENLFRFAHAAAVNTLDVTQSATLETRRVSQQILDTLVQPNPDTGAPDASLADSWDSNNQGTTVTFHLRDGITFHDGTALTAQAVVDNVTRWKILATQAASQTSAPYRTLFAAPSSSKEIKPLVTEVKAAEQKVIFTLSRASTLFLPALTQAAFGIVKPGTWNEKGQVTGNIIGTGAFQLQSWQDGEAKLTANPSYWGQQKPSIDGIVFTSISTADKRYYALMNNEIDAYDQVDKNDFVPLAKSGLITQMRDPYAAVSINLNLEHPVLSNVFVRRAIAHAINRGDITGPYFLQGSYDAYSYIPKSLQIADQEFEPYLKGDSSLAQALLERSGYQQEPITFYYPTGTNLTALPHAEAVYARLAASLGKIGLNIKPTPIAYDDGYYEKIAAANKECGISLIEHFGAYRGTMAFVEQLMSSLPQGFFDTKISPTELEQVEPTPSATPTPSPSSTEEALDIASVVIPERDSTPLPENFPANLLKAIIESDKPAEVDNSRTANTEMLKLWCQLMPSIPVTFTVSAVAQGKKVNYLPVSSSGISSFSRVTMAN